MHFKKPAEDTMMNVSIKNPEVESLAILLALSPSFREEVFSEFQKLKEKFPDTPPEKILENAVINVFVKHKIITLH